MTVALGIIGNYNFFLLFPLYFFEIYNFELISFFRFCLPYMDSGNPFSLCKNIWAYSMEGISKCGFFSLEKLGTVRNCIFAKYQRHHAPVFFSTILFLFLFWLFWAFFMLIKLYIVNSRLLSGFLVISLYRWTVHSKAR